MHENFPWVLDATEIRLLDSITDRGALMADRGTRVSVLKRQELSDIERWAFDLGRRETEWIMEHAGKC